MGQIIKMFIVHGLPFLFKWLGHLIDKDKERKAKKKEALKEVTHGIKTGNNSEVTAGFDKLNRI